MKHPLIIERPDLQARGQRALYSLITLAAWALWGYLLTPLLSLAAWALGLRAFVEEMLLPQNLDYLHEVLLYASILLLVLTVIVGWSRYNLRRFRGVDRRAAPSPLRPEEEAAFYHLDPQLLIELKQARVATLVFDEQHRLRWLRPRPAAVPAVREEALPA